MKYTRSTPKSEKTVKFRVSFIEEDIELVSFADMPWEALVKMGTDADPRGVLEHVPGELLETLEECNGGELGEFLEAWVDATTKAEQQSGEVDDAFSRIMKGWE